MKLNIYELLHQSELHLEYPLLVLTQGKIVSMQQQSPRARELLDVLTGMIKLFTFDAYALVDPGAILCFLNTYIEIQFEILTTKL